LRNRTVSGCAQAQANFLHPCRGLSSGRDEARHHRAHRRRVAGGRDHPNDNVFDKTLSNLKEVESCNGRIIEVTDKRTARSDCEDPVHNFRSADRRRLGRRSTTGRERWTPHARRISGESRAPATCGIGIRTRCWRIVRGRLSRIRSRLRRCSAVLGLPRPAALQEG
jgi:hypothetical protein